MTKSFSSFLQEIGDNPIVVPRIIVEGKMIAIGYFDHFAPFFPEMRNIGEPPVLGAIYEDLGNFKLGKPLNQISIIGIVDEGRGIIKNCLWG